MKILMRTIAVCLLFTVGWLSVFASGITHEAGNNVLELSGAFGKDYAYRMISLQMIGPFTEPTAFSDAVETVENTAAPLTKTAFITLYLDESGSFSYSFYPAEDNAFYTAAAYTDGMDEPWSEIILNVSDTLEGDIVELLNAAQSGDEIANLFENPDYYNALTYRYPIFGTIEEQKHLDMVYEEIYNAKEEEAFTDLLETYAAVLLPVSAVMNINEMAKSETEEARLIAEENIPLDSAPLYESYEKMTTAQKDNVFKRLIGKEITTADEMLELFGKAVFLQLIEQETLKNNLTSLLNKNAETYDVDIDGYSDETKAVNNAIYQKYFETTDELSEAIQDAIEAADSDTGSGGGSSGGSGGGGGSFSTSPVVIPSAAVPQVQEKQLSFDDLGDVVWAQDAIEELYKLGVINGRAERTFAPNEKINREEFVKMLVLAMNKPLDGESVAFTDTVEGDWHYPYIAAGVKLGWVKGISETLFGVGDPLTRQDMAVLIDRAAALASEPSQELFADDASIADYARASVYRLRGAEIINGDEANNFNPQAYATRAEAAKMIYELIRQEG